MRLQQTVVYLFVSVLAFGTMVTLVARADADERAARLDASMRTTAEAAAALVYFERNRLELAELAADPVASGRPQVVVYRGTPPVRRVFATKRPGVRVADSELLPLAADAVGESTEARGTAVAEDGGERRLLATPFYDNGGEVAGAVVVVGDPAAVAAGRNRLLAALVLGGAGLLLVASVSSYLLTRRSTRVLRDALRRQHRLAGGAERSLRTVVVELRRSALAALSDPARRDALPARTVVVCAQLDFTIDDIMLSSRLDAGTYRLVRKPVRLDVLVTRIATSLGAGEVDLATRPCTVVVDEALVEHAVRHLVVNALRHGRPRVDVEVHGDGRVSVSDRGQGVGREVTAALYYGVARTASPGVGRGLSMCLWAARLHGGTFTVAGRSGGGTVCTLHLQPEAAGTAEPPVDRPVGAAVAGQ